MKNFEEPTYPFRNEALFPIPKITESFIDDIVSKISGKRYTDLYKVKDGILNADYIFENSISELKILEEEGLLKKDRQLKIHELLKYENIIFNNEYFDLNIIPDDKKIDYDKIIIKPLQKAITKAAKQIKATKQELNVLNNDGVLIIINNGYSSIQHESFCKLVSWSCAKDTSQIKYAICISLSYHQGNFNSNILLKKECIKIRTEEEWQYWESFNEQVNIKYREAMTQIMVNQMNPNFWQNKLEPVKDISFTKDGVEYKQDAPYLE